MISSSDERRIYLILILLSYLYSFQVFDLIHKVFKLDLERGTSET